MADITWSDSPLIHQIKLPSGTSYYIKDKEVREKLEALSDTVVALGSPTHFIGAAASSLSDGSTLKPISISGQSSTVTQAKGDIVVKGDKEYIWDGTTWHAFGDLSNIALSKVTTKPLSASGTVTAPKTAVTISAKTAKALTGLPTTGNTAAAQTITIGAGTRDTGNVNVVTDIQTAVGSVTLSTGTSGGVTVMTGVSTATVSIPTFKNASTTRLAISRSQDAEVEVSTSADAIVNITPASTSFVTSYPGSFNKLKTTQINPAGTATSVYNGILASGGKEKYVYSYSVSNCAAAGTTSFYSVSSGSSSVNSITDRGTLPVLTTSVANEVLTISFSQGTLPASTEVTGLAQLSNEKTVNSGIGKYTVSASASSDSLSNAFDTTNVATVGTAVTVATGGLSSNDATQNVGDSVMVGLGEAGTGYALTGLGTISKSTFAKAVSIKTQPEFAFSNPTTGGQVVATAGIIQDSSTTSNVEITPTTTHLTASTTAQNITSVTVKGISASAAASSVTLGTAASADFWNGYNAGVDNTYAASGAVTGITTTEVLSSSTSITGISE